MNAPLSSETIVVELAKARNFFVVSNAISNPRYAPYCLRCTGMQRMKLVEPFLWEHECGAVHDERQVIS
jgi:hypothetical protein